jgi:hypothetical protein
MIFFIQQGKFGRPSSDLTQCRYFRDEILACLLYQPDATVNGESHPAICSVLFHLHEYDRPLYKKFLTELLAFREVHGIELERNMSVDTVVLSFGLVDAEQRYRLIDKFFSDFGLYSHWTFVLLASAWNDVWDTSLANQANLHIASEILESRLETIDEWSPELLFRAFVLADICCRDTIPRLLLNTPLRLQRDDKLGDYREDPSCICRNSPSELSTPVPVISLDRPLCVAVCVSGKLRGYRKAFPTWRMLGLGEHQVTYIIHTWEDVGGGYPIPPKDARVLSRTLLEPFRAARNELGQDEMFARYQAFFGLWPKERVVVEQDDLCTFYGTEFISVEDDSEERFKPFSNAKKMYYKIERCHQAAKSLGVEFSLMVRIRPDWAFQKPGEINWHELFRHASLKKTLFVDGAQRCQRGAPYLFPHIGYSMGDQFAIATPTAMDGYATDYTLTLDRINGTGPRHVPTNCMAHRNVAFANLYSGVTVNDLVIPVQLAPVHGPSSAAILTAILSAARDDETHCRLVRAAALDAGVEA